jgi:hypothetical protein
VTYVAAPCRFFTGFDWGDETYFLSDRPTSDDRFYYYDKRLTAGVQWPLTQSLKLELSSGYVFERFYYEGGTSYSDRFTNRLDIGAGPFVALQLQTKF